MRSHLGKPGNTTLRMEIVSCQGFTKFHQTEHFFVISECFKCQVSPFFTHSAVMQFVSCLRSVLEYKIKIFRTLLEFFQEKTGIQNFVSLFYIFCLVTLRFRACACFITARQAWLSRFYQNERFSYLKFNVFLVKCAAIHRQLVQYARNYKNAPPVDFTLYFVFWLFLFCLEMIIDWRLKV